MEENPLVVFTVWVKDCASIFYDDGVGATPRFVVAAPAWWRDPASSETFGISSKLRALLQ